METKILHVKNQNQKDVILKILEDDNPTTYHTFEDYDNENILIDGLISFEAMAEIVDYLRCIFKKGVWYRCIKDVFDNENKLCLFTKGEYYICPNDNTLLANNNKVIRCNNLNNLSECFVEDYYKNK